MLSVPADLGTPGSQRQEQTPEVNQGGAHTASPLQAGVCAQLSLRGQHPPTSAQRGDEPPKPSTDSSSKRCHGGVSSQMLWREAGGRKELGAGGIEKDPW